MQNAVVQMAIIRFLRTVIPQLPAVFTYLLALAQQNTVPVWVVPALVFAGAVATALDKFAREMGLYQKTVDYLVGQ